MSDPEGGGPEGSPPSGVPAGWLPLERAVRAWRAGRADAVVDVRIDLGEAVDGADDTADEGGDDGPDGDVLPVRVLFRTPEDFHPVESAAVDAALGSVLDVGAGAGAVAVVLQARAHAVTAVEPMPALAEVLRERGVVDVRGGSVLDLQGADRFDTVLCLMNGTGLAGTGGGLESFLAALADRTARGGRILIDSTDPAEWPEPDDGRRAGEVHLQLGFDGVWGDPLPWLYVGPDDLMAAAGALGMAGRVLLRADDDRYLVELAPPGG